MIVLGDFNLSPTTTGMLALFIFPSQKALIDTYEIIKNILKTLWNSVFLCVLGANVEVWEIFIRTNYEWKYYCRFKMSDVMVNKTPDVYSYAAILQNSWFVYILIA